MYNGKYVSTEFIIDKIQKDYGFTSSMDKYEIADDIFDAVELIGVPMAFIRRITNGEGSNPDVISVADYAAELPCDLRSLEGVRTYDTKLPLIEDTSTFKAQEGASNDPYEGTSEYLVYHINDNFIFTNFEEGDIEISYLAFPTDDNGIPLIPDDTRYINGIVAYVAERIGFRQWWKGNLGDKQYSFLQAERAFCIPSAATSLNMPSYDMAQSMSNQLSRLIKSSNHQAYNFKFLNSKEMLKVHN